jgi:hypothetical protein
VSQELEQRLAAARERVRELGSSLRKDTMQAWREAWQQQLQAERDLAAARGEQYAEVIDIGPRWDTGAPLPHLVSNGSRAFVVCRARAPDPGWDGTYVRVVSPADEHPAPFVVTEMWACAEVRFGGPNDEAIGGHPLHGKGLEGYRAHEVVNSAWIEEAIKVNSVHPQHSDAPFRLLRHYALLFHDEMLEALAGGIESRLVTGTMAAILEGLAGTLTGQPHRVGLPRGYRYELGCWPAVRKGANLHHAARWPYAGVCVGARGAGALEAEDSEGEWSRGDRCLVHGDAGVLYRGCAG